MPLHWSTCRAACTKLLWGHHVGTDGTGMRKQPNNDFKPLWPVFCCLPGVSRVPTTPSSTVTHTGLGLSCLTTAETRNRVKLGCHSTGHGHHCSPGPRHCQPKDGSGWPRRCILRKPWEDTAPAFKHSPSLGPCTNTYRLKPVAAPEMRVWGFFALLYIPHGAESKAGCALEQGWGIPCPCPALLNPDDPSSYSHIMS